MINSINTDNHSFSPLVASILSIEKAIILKDLYNLCDYKLKNNLLKHGLPFAYYSSKALADKYPYMKEASIRRWMVEMEDDGYIYSAVINKMKIDKTKSYIVNFDRYNNLSLGVDSSAQFVEEWRLSIAQKLNMVAQNEQWLAWNEQAITYSTDSQQKDLRPKSDFPEPLKTEKKKEGIENDTDSVAITLSDEIKMAMSRTDLKARIKYVLEAPWCSDFPKLYGRSKSNLAADVLEAMMNDGGFVGGDNAAIADWIRKFIKRRTKKSSERTFSEETTAIVNDLIKRVLNASPYNKLIQPLRDFEKTKMAEWVESRPGIRHWHAFDILIDLFSRSGSSPEYLTVSNALGKYAEENKENLKMEYNLRLKRLGLK